MAESEISSDRPIQEESQDRLGFSAFAEYLAGSLTHAQTSDGFVVAVHGVWGSGKTSLMNLVTRYCDQSEDDSAPVVISFNPWWFSGQDLTFRFFSEIAAALGGEPGWGKVRARLAEFAEVVSPPLASLPYVGAVGFSLDKAGKLLLPKKTTEQVKSALATRLKESKKKLLIIVDDIDRLSAIEVRELFQLIKAIADLPNVIYLLAFDREMVARALSEIQKDSGYAYLEKIVQVSFELPTPDPGAVHELLFGHLNKVLKDVPAERFNQINWANAFADGIRNLIKTPRQAALLGNAVVLTFPPVRGEVDPVDFISLEALRLFARPAYDAIRNNPSEFTGVMDDIYTRGSTRIESMRHFHDSWLGLVNEDDREYVKALVRRMFPRLEAVWANNHYGSDFLRTWRRNLRIASPDIFPTYFKLGVPQHSISATEIEAILSTLD